MKVLGYEYDPLTGVKVTHGFQDDLLVVKTEQDVAPALDYLQKLRNAPEYSKEGIKKNFMHAVHIPDAVAAKMLTEDGFDVYRRSAKEVRLFLRRNRDKYGYLYATAGKI